MKRLKTEHYAVGEVERDGISVTVGISYDPKDNPDVEDLGHAAKRFAQVALHYEGGNHVRVVAVVRLGLEHQYPGRPYYVETREEGVGVQVFQPYGIPQDDEPPAKQPSPPVGRCWCEDYKDARPQ